MSQQPLKLDDAHDYLQKVIESLRMLERHEKGPLVNILEYISGYIRASREEIRALRHDENPDGFFSVATDELEEIVNELTRATNTIMSAAETIEEAAGKAEDPELAEALRQEATRIYEACTFHDITGQRIAKIVRTLQSLESRVNALATVVGTGIVGTDAPQAKEGGVKLENGPQLSTAAQTQDEIDRLFDSLA